MLRRPVADGGQVPQPKSSSTSLSYEGVGGSLGRPTAAHSLRTVPRFILCPFLNAPIVGRRSWTSQHWRRGAKPSRIRTVTERLWTAKGGVSNAWWG
jgi:hypothetical protein